MTELLGQTDDSVDSLFCSCGDCVEVVRGKDSYYFLDNKGDSRETANYRFGAFVLAADVFEQLKTDVVSAEQHGADRNEIIDIASRFMIDQSVGGEGGNIAHKVYDQPDELVNFTAGIIDGQFDGMQDGDIVIAKVDPFVASRLLDR